MGLAIRIIPVVLYRGDQLVKGEKFQSWRNVGNAYQAASIYAARQVDELILLDIAATPEGRGPDFDMVKKWTDNNFSPITVGGGVRSVEDVRQLLEAGADKVAICTEWPVIKQAAKEFGSQAIVGCIDIKGGYVCWECGATSSGAGDDPVHYAKMITYKGCGEILLTSIDRDGTLEGYDLPWIRAISEEIKVPLIANGGCGNFMDMHEAIKAGASAVAAGALFQWTDSTPRQAAEYLACKGVEVRV